MVTNENLYCGVDIKNLKFIGKGTQGSVYLLSEDKVIKVFNKKKGCKDQIDTLLKVQKSKFFTKVYDYDENSIIMEFLPGENLKKYLVKNPLTKEMALQLVEVIKEFKNLGFKRIDIRLNHIYLQPDGSLKVIDPRKSYVSDEPYPENMLRGLSKRKCYNLFFDLIKDIYPQEYKEWINKLLV